MATYRKLVSSISPYDVTSTLTSPSATSVTVQLSDGTTLVLTGTGFVVTGGVLTAGSVTSMAHKNTAGTDIETWTSIPNFPAPLFQSFLTPTPNTVGLFTEILRLNDNLRGNSGVDTLLGYGGDDLLQGLAGNDILDGGSGTDTANYGLDNGSGGTAGVVVNLSANAVNFGGVVAAGTARDGFGNTDTLISIENAYGTGFADILVGGTGGNFFRGSGGSDTYISNIVQYVANYYSNGFSFVDYQFDGGSSGVTVNFATGIGADSFGNAEYYTNIVAVRGTGLSDTFTGNQFHNFFQGLAGADIIDGGGGYDRVGYDRDADSANGTAGVTVDLQAGTATDGFGNSDTLISIEEVVATNANDTLRGNAWNNFLAGRNGADTLVGRDGFDTFRPGLGADIVDGSPGSNGDQSHDDRDQVDYSDVTAATGTLGVIVNLSTVAITHEGSTVAGNTARDVGGATNDTLTDIERVRGTTGRDYFRGSDTANLREELFRGGAGDDYIHGGAGYNIVRYSGDTADYGGSGAGGTLGVIVNLSASSITALGATVASNTARDAFGNIDTLVNIQGVRGTGLGDYVVGGAGFDFFRGSGGADFFDGGAGDRDVISLFLDDDFFATTGAGFTVDMTAGTAISFFDGATSYFVNVESVEGSERSDTITGNGLANRLFGDQGNDIINGGDGDDFLTGGTGSDTLNGGAGFDFVSYQFDPTYGAFANLQQAGRFPTPWTGISINLATGFATDFAGGVDTIVVGTVEGVIGSFLNDVIYGDGGNNRFIGLSGNDYIDGAGGIDTISFAPVGNTGGTGAPDLIGINASRPNGVTVDLAAGIANDSEGGVDTLISIENVFGSTGNDIITGNAGANTLEGGDGNDILNGGGDVDFLFGGAGNDTIDGGTGGDYMVGGAGDDTYIIDTNLDGIVEVFGEGTDTVRSNLVFTQLDASFTLENLVYTGAAGGTLFGNSANNVITGGNESDNLNGFFGSDTLNGGGGNDFIYADENDIIDGGSGTDAVYVQSVSGITLNLATSNVEFVVGFSGNDVLNAQASMTSVTLIGGAGADQLRGGSANDFIYFDADDTVVDAGGGTNDVLVATGAAGVTLNVTAANAEYVIGSGGNDVLDATGSANAVVIQGGVGADTITGGNGNDYLFGNEGADIFKVTANAQFDAVFDFVDTGGADDDRINVSALGANFDTIEEILAATTDYGGTSLINFGGGNLLYLFMVPKTGLTADDFIFSV